MHRQVNAIAGRLSLRAPQRHSLELLDRLMEVFPPLRDAKEADPAQLLEVLRSEFPTLKDFEREFPSVGFSLATGVGKTRLMGAFIAYLHLAHGINNFFVLAPNLTIYEKLIQDFTPNTPKYVFKGIAEFAINPPAVITGENYADRVGDLFYETLACKINVFNISKINSEVRGGKAPRIKQLGEYLGESYFAYLSKLPDLVLLMDESHRYRASAGVRALNELRPILGLELTATPYVETTKGPVPFKNIIFDYRLAKAMEDGFVKEPAVVTRKDFNPKGLLPEALEDLKLRDGIRLHEQVKVELETYARQTGQHLVKPFVLVIARDTTHAAQLLTHIKSDEFFKGAYRDKVIQVDSSTKEEEVIERLLKVEQADEPTEIVIHVNMLKEGWDVTNLYTIVPLRAANARVLIEQSIGRGLRLPYGKRTGVEAVDTLNIVAHDRFQEIVDEARRPGSVLQLKEIQLDDSSFSQSIKTTVSQSMLANQLGLNPVAGPGQASVAGQTTTPPVFAKPEEQQLAQLAYAEIKRLANRPNTAPLQSNLTSSEVQAAIVKAVEARQPPLQLNLELDNTASKPDVAAIVAKTFALIKQQTIDIPRVLIVPKGEVSSGYHSFTLDLSGMKYQAIPDELWIQRLRTGDKTVVSLGRDGVEEQRLEDYVVAGLVDFDDVNYYEHADLLYDLASQVVQHFTSYLTLDDTRRVLRSYQKEIAGAVHVQMLAHAWDESTDGYDVKVSQGFTELKQSAYTTSANEPVLDYRVAPTNKSNMPRYLFGGFERCLYAVQKFDSDTERALAVILERDAEKWFRPAKGQFQIHYQENHELAEYQPDFVAETAEAIYMLEPKSTREMNDAIVLAKQKAAETWCAHATEYTSLTGGKPWQYVLIPHTAVAENKTLKGLVREYGSAVLITTKS
ncbi:DEAD/DEAH box helicase [Hymenobacter glacieicola]|uniref:Type III restriction endonuclease subunit R n=1 Tax=Hymenobacter glacieicola TaxID=1562124 RepID=A0ABQ1WNH1_9BACT|nr:DEAD/DEAH box helicase family protein [Hymenobacter glacieicola]GGG35522.1 type III restriction endonuclease subunit R [Hymenobacter glacieicola]